MGFENYRREILSIEASPDLAEETIKRILQEESARGCSDVTLRSVPFRSRLRGCRQKRRPLAAACIILCLALGLGGAASLAVFLGSEPVAAHIPRNNQENIRLEAASTGLIDDAFVIDAEVLLNVFFGGAGTRYVLVSLDDARLGLIGIEDDLIAPDSLNFGMPYRTTCDDGAIHLMLRMRLDPNDTVAQRLLSETDDTAAYRSYAILKTITDALEFSTLTIVDESSGECQEYSFDIQRFENQWDYEHQLRKGGPAIISLQRKG